MVMDEVGGGCEGGRDMVNRLSGGSVSHRWSRGGGGSVTLE